MNRSRYSAFKIMWKRTTVFKILFVVGLLTSLCYAASIPAPPPLPDESAVEQDYFQKIYNNLNRLDVVTSAPNGVLKGDKGQLVLYNNAGTFSLYCNTDGATAWQAL